MLHRIQSPSLTRLAEQLAKYFQDTPREDPFSREWIIVQNKEVEQWLSLELAQQLGVAGNIEFSLPSELFWSLYRTLQPELPSVLPSDRGPMQWFIFELLEVHKAELADFGLPTLNTQQQRLNFSAQLADVFDLYQIYRPDMLKLWEDKSPNQFVEHQRWQAFLWKKLRDRWFWKYPDVPARSEILEQLKEHLSHQGNDFLPQRITVFGLSQWSKPFADLMLLLADYIDILFFDVGYDTSSQNSSSRAILSDWFSPKTSSESLLATAKARYESLISLNTGRHIQQSLTTKVHRAPNVRREVEVLKNELLQFLDNHADVQTSDLLIMVPDMEVYGHVIEAEFTQQKGDTILPVYIPEKRSNRSATELVLMVFHFLNDQEKITGFLELLEQPTVRERWGINQAEITQIKNWFADLNTHWGLEFKESRFSLERALSALYSGFCMELDGYETAGNVVPFDGVSSGDHLQIITKLSGFIHFLMDIKAAILDLRPVQEWVSLSEKWCDGLYPENDQSVQVFRSLSESLKLAGSKELIPVDLYEEWLHTQVKADSAQSSRLGRGIVVSSYIPYRNIPFKVVAILGFNEGAFPRNPHRPSFDLISNNPQPGERLTKTDDVLLFAERISSTSDFLHLSYVGDNQTGDNPSLLLHQFAELVGPEFPNTVHHKLHGFDEVATMTSGNYSSYSEKLAEQLRNFGKNQLRFLSPSENKSPGSENEFIHLKDLIQFFVHPCKYLAKKELGIFEVFENSIPEDRENFSLNGLKKYKVKQILQEAKVEGEDAADLRHYLYKKGILPDGTTGFDEFSELNDQVTLLIEEINQIADGSPETLEVDYQGNDWRLTGTIDEVYNGLKIGWRIGAIRAQHYLECWINHLAGTLVNPALESIFLGIEKDSISRIEFEVVQNPKDELSRLIELFGSTNPPETRFLAIPNCGFAYFKEFRKKEDHQKALELSTKAWEGESQPNYHIPGAKEDFYNRWFWKDETPVDRPGFESIAVKIWEPIFRSLKEVPK